LEKDGVSLYSARVKRHLEKFFNAEFAKKRRTAFKQYRFQTLKPAVNAFIKHQKAKGLVLDEAYTDEQTSVSPVWREAVQPPRQQEAESVPLPPKSGSAGDCSGANSQRISMRIVEGPRAGEFLFSAGTAAKIDRLKPVDTPNSRTTLEGSLDSMNRAYGLVTDANTAPGADPPTMSSEEARAAERMAAQLLERATVALDLSQVPEELRRDIGEETAMQIKEESIDATVWRIGTSIAGFLCGGVLVQERILDLIRSRGTAGGEIPRRVRCRRCLQSLGARRTALRALRLGLVVRLAEDDPRQEGEVDHVGGDVQVVIQQGVEKHQEDADPGADLHVAELRPPFLRPYLAPPQGIEHEHRQDEQCGDRAATLNLVICRNNHQRIVDRW
jgi:hypothetical protein